MTFFKSSGLLVFLGLVSIILVDSSSSDTDATNKILTKIDQINKTLDDRMDDIIGQ